MEILEIDPLDEQRVRRHWEIGKAAEDAYRPYDSYGSWQQFWLRTSGGRDDADVVLLGAVGEDGLMWGAAKVQLTRHDNLHAADVLVYTHPDRQRSGIGTALMEATARVADGAGRRVLHSEAYAALDEPSAGLLFAERMGFAAALEDTMKMVDLPATQPTWEALAASVAPRHSGYEIRTWRDLLDDDLVDDYCRLSQMFLAEAPMGDMEVENERWDAARVRARERDNLGIGRRQCGAMALSSAGRMVAVTEIWVNDDAPSPGYQSGTLVDPGHRGHGLGTAIKLANHRQVREHFPDCEQLITGNAGVNAPMNAVNELLGYRDIERCVELQRIL